MPTQIELINKLTNFPRTNSVDEAWVIWPMAWKAFLSLLGIGMLLLPPTASYVCKPNTNSM